MDEFHKSNEIYRATLTFKFLSTKINFENCYYKQRNAYHLKYRMEKRYDMYPVSDWYTEGEGHQNVRRQKDEK